MGSVETFDPQFWLLYDRATLKVKVSRQMTLMFKNYVCVDWQRVHVLRYSCMHACMHACMYACMHVRMYACMHVCMYACMHVYTYK